MGSDDETDMWMAEFENKIQTTTKTKTLRDPGNIAIMAETVSFSVGPSQTVTQFLNPFECFSTIC